MLDMAHQQQFETPVASLRAEMSGSQGHALLWSETVPETCCCLRRFFSQDIKVISI